MTPGEEIVRVVAPWKIMEAEGIAAFVDGFLGYGLDEATLAQMRAGCSRVVDAFERLGDRLDQALIAIEVDR